MRLNKYSDTTSRKPPMKKPHYGDAYARCTIITLKHSTGIVTQRVKKLIVHKQWALTDSTAHSTASYYPSGDHAG